MLIVKLLVIQFPTPHTQLLDHWLHSKLLGVRRFNKSRRMLCAYILLVYYCLVTPRAASATGFSAVELLKDPGAIVSDNGNFKFGFFGLPKTQNRYLGIWYNKVSPTYYVWVANRNNPLKDSSGMLRISEEGDLQVLNGKEIILWSQNLTRPTQNVTRGIKLLNSGNLVVLEHPSSNKNATNGTIVWQSFDYPTDSVLPNMKPFVSSTGTERLYAWKSASDPSIGRYSIGLDSVNHPQMVIWDGNKRHYRSGPWNGNVFLGMSYADPTGDYTDSIVQTNNTGDGVSVVYTGPPNLTYSHLTFNYNGSISEVFWDSGSKSWVTIYQDPVGECDFYGKCGTFGTCNSQNKPICRCLKGFVPKKPEEWSKGNWSSGCVRRAPLQCARNGTGQDGFLLLGTIKLPDFEEWLAVLNQNDCRTQCLQNCSCLAYAYDAGAGCMYWSTDLIDIQQFTSGGINLYLRLASSELSNHKRKKSIIIAASVILGTSSITIFTLLLWQWLHRRKEKQARRKRILETIKYNDKGDQQTKFEELPFFEFEILVDATQNFSLSHKLGQGGFGEVYKGKLKDGREVAVKRLSAVSGQGLEEFRNEVIVISRLQHMNLVKLIGFCVEGDEKLLVYEYMPNKSLSAFLFDPVKRELLDWSKRLNIIEGICRGLIYLHRDSRLRIIHRDLKASNILLDDQLNPKISDFGMARIFRHGQDEDETRRVVGTYGYMAPEYAMEGHFSEKSDVYSFGVLLLEIVSGKRNNTFWFEEESLTLLGYVWKLWIEDQAASLIDPIISDPKHNEEIIRSIQVGLLCVQESVNARPTTSTVMSMLSSDISNLPHPKQPGFNRRQIFEDDGSSQLPSSCGNNVSITTLSAR